MIMNITITETTFIIMKTSKLDLDLIMNSIVIESPSKIEINEPFLIEIYIPFLLFVISC